jgi:hypothetical protein
MNLIMSRKPALQAAKSLSMLLVGAALAATATAWAATPFFSGPSIAKPSTQAPFVGKGFTPNTSLTVMIKAPSGTAAGYSVVTDATGEFSYLLLPTQTGAYTITITDSGGRALATAAVAVLP